MLMPRKKTPDLTVPLLGGGQFDISAVNSPRGSVVCFYRGLHCPLCATYLTEFEKLADDFAERGLACVAISSDGADRAQGMADKIGASKLQFGYDLNLTTARNWGLYISTSRGKTSIGIDEPALFAEPGLFLINADQTLYYMSVQTMPFVRPHFRELLRAVDFAIEKNYPARGEYDGPV
ncbi:AhpC/TSA family protein [Rhodophyticola sp. CCM32]|uniref:peroxiredoxin-like family protein n=1 Tax=Rhodophyticola sp. CCM32 TaxID=2916397 RepID=UPI00107FC1BF|nr:peroxiredoxin-like family protein [Rhodophyticola sp. CCM32]QBY02284.1 AhpC/TSA family protein [Rhodophyticola sp. CCM32]